MLLLSFSHHCGYKIIFLGLALDYDLILFESGGAAVHVCVSGLVCSVSLGALIVSKDFIDTMSRDLGMERWPLLVRDRM